MAWYQVEIWEDGSIQFDPTWWKKWKWWKTREQKLSPKTTCFGTAWRHVASISLNRTTSLFWEWEIKNPVKRTLGCHVFSRTLKQLYWKDCFYQATGETPLVLPRLPPHLLCQHRRDRRDRHDTTGLGTSKSMLKFIVPVSGCHDIPFWNMSHP